MAGRKDKNTVDYFPHYVNHGKTLFILESKYGLEGYAAWFKILEMLGKSENHYIDCRDESDWEFMCAKIPLMHTEMHEYLNLCAKLGAINAELWGKKVIYSENFVKNISDAYKRRSNNCLDVEDILNIIDNNACINSINVNINSNNADKNTQSKEKKSKENKSKEEENGVASFDVKTDSSLPEDKKKRTPRSSAAPPLNFPFKGEKFNGLWAKLMTSKKWAKKTDSALQMSLDKLAKYDEEFVCLLISDAIEKDWQGVVYDDTPEKYRKWKMGNGGANSMANPELVRTGQVLHTTTENQQRIIDKMYERNGLKRDDKQAGTA